MGKILGRLLYVYTGLWAARNGGTWGLRVVGVIVFLTSFKI
jgi:hypothetical protein